MKWGRGSAKPFIDITQLTVDTIKFTLHNSDVTLANALRRIMLSEIPCLAIEIVTVLENDTPLHDEYIAHRLGLLPIDSTRISEFEYRDKCSCSDKCSKCTVDYNLQVTCTEPFRTVTHLDIIPDEYDTPLPLPRSGDGIPIVKIRRDQSIHLKLTATKGIGKLHAKWVVANVAYQIEPLFKINSEMMGRTTQQDRATIASSCPRGILVSEDDNYGGTIRVTNSLECIYCDSCINTCKDLGFKGLIRIEPDETKFHFSVEVRPIQ